MILSAWSKHSRGWNASGVDTRSRIQHYPCKACRDSNTESARYYTSLETSKSLGKRSGMEWTLERPVSNSIHVQAILPRVYAFIARWQITGMEIYPRSREGRAWSDFRYGRRILDVISWFYTPFHSTRDMQLKSRFLNCRRHRCREETLGDERVWGRMGARCNSGWL